MKIGIIGDAHLGCTDFSPKRRSDFSTAFTNALSLCRQQQAEVVCLLGDVFDSAAIKRNVDAFADLLAEIAPALEDLKRNQVPLIAIPGNHEYGRGREAGELRALESLGYVHVLRSSFKDFGEVGICGIPWQEDKSLIAPAARHLEETCKSRRRILLLHNYIHGSQTIPDFLWEVTPQVADGFDQVFAGHHHVFEQVGKFAMPGSTEVQSMLDAGDKGILLYDTQTENITRHPLPVVHPTLVLKYDLAQLSGPPLLERLRDDLRPLANKKAFVYVRVFGTVDAGVSLSKSEFLAILREFDLFDSYIDLRHRTIAKSAKQSIAGSSIEAHLRRAFSGPKLDKAKDYISSDLDPDALFVKVRDRILS